MPKGIFLILSIHNGCTPSVVYILNQPCHIERPLEFVHTDTRNTMRNFKPTATESIFVSNGNSDSPLIEHCTVFI